MPYWIDLNNISSDIRLDSGYYAMEIEIRKLLADESVVLLEEIADIITDGTRNAKYFSEEGIPYLRIANLTPPVISKTKLLYIPSYEGIEERAVVSEGDILIPKTGSLEKILRVDVSFAGTVLGPDIIRIKLKCSEDSPLLLDFLQSPVGRMLIYQSVKGTTIPRISVNQLKKLRIPVFNQEERNTIFELYRKQQDKKENISKLYERWNNLYRLRSYYLQDKVLPDTFFIKTSDIDSTRLDFKYYQLQQSRLYQELLDRTTWEEWVELNTITEIVRTTIKPRDWKGTFIRYIGLGSVNPETFQVSEVEEIEYRKAEDRARYLAVEKDIILGIMGPNIGEKNQALAIITKEWENSLISSVFAVIRCGDFSPYYLLWCLQHPLVRLQMRRLARGQWQSMLAISDVGTLLVPWLELDKQEKISVTVKSYIDLMKART